MADAPPPSIVGALTSKPTIGLTVEQKDLSKLAAKLAAEANGKKLRLSLAAKLRIAVAPAVKEVKAGALAIGGHATGSLPGKKVPVSDTMSLGTAIAQGISTQTRLTGPRVGVKVKASKKGMPRGFKNAPQRMNRPEFKHPLFGNRKVWIVQVGNPDFFDGPLRRDKVKYRLAIIAAIEEMSARIAKK